MARRQFVTVRERDLGAGIDQQSAENQLKEGYAEDIENADPKSTGQIVKRQGYQGYAGNIPVRVKEVEYNGTQIDFILDNSIELPTGQSTPLIVQGKTSEASGDFASENILYFENFTADIRKTLSTGTGTATLPTDEHDISTPLMFVGTALSTSTTNNSNTQFFADSITINQSTRDISVGYTNNTGSNFDAFFFAKDKSAVTGQTYVQSGNTVNTGTNSFTILGSTHQLDNNNIIVEAYSDDGTDYVRIQADEITLDDSNGDVTITVENTSGSSFDAVFILTSAPTANFATGSVASGNTQSIIIDTTGTDATDFAFVACYLEPTIGGTLEQVIPDNIVSNSVDGTITVTFTNNTASGANFEVYWDFANVVTNQLSVTGTASASFIDTAPQLTIWGLDHSEIYGTKVAREGWANHIDSYRASGENRLIAGLGGNLFAARLRNEGTNASDLLMPLLYPRLNARVTSDTILGPAFYDTGEMPGRTRGFITGDNGGTNFFEITEVTYNSGTGNVDYTLTVPNMSIEGTLSTIVSTVAGFEDIFTVQQCGYSVHNGEFAVKAIASPTATTITVSVENPQIDTSDFDEVDVGGLGGIFTDRVTLTATSPFLEDDLIDSDIFSDTDNFVCVNSSSATVLIKNVVETVSIPGGLRLVGTRTSSVLPLRNDSNTATVENLVRGDMLQYTGINRQLRVRAINQLSDTSITIAGDGETATVTLGSGDTSTLFVGKKLLISETSSYNGAIEITSIGTSTTFTFATTSSTTESGTLVGKTVEVDEDLTYSDTTDSSITVSVDSRWIPVESPTDSYDLTPSTRISYFDSLGYESQNIIRSTMVQDNLYLTNDSDEVMKFDGTNIYRAGLFRWQPNLFVTTDTGATGRIVTGNTSVAYDTATESRFEFTTTPENGLEFNVGQEVQDAQDGNANYIVERVESVSDSAGALIKSIVYVNRSITGTTGTKELTPVSVYYYYFRLNAVDANNNVVASAVTGSEDFVVKLPEDAAVNLKLVGLPAWDVYDYDRLEVQIYRTTGDSPAPFYRLSTLAMSFNSNDGYILYTDTDSDEDLQNLDEVNTALKGAELGTAWEQPLRAKYCTSAGNRLILGNLKDYPTLDIRVLKKNAATLTQAVFTGADNKDWLFKKDNTDSGTTTDMVNRVNYEFVSSSSTVSGITGTADTSFSVNVVGHGLPIGTQGYWVYLFHSAVNSGNDLRYSGWWQVNSVTDANNFVVRSANADSGAASNFPDSVAIATAPLDVPIYLGDDGNYAMVNGNSVAGSPYSFRAMRRMADAINTSMRKVDTTISGYENFEPWMAGNAGNEFNAGQLVVKQPKVFDTTLEVQLPGLSGAFDVFVNSVRRSGSEQVSSLTRLFPSRIIASYQNYPEIFDNPTATVDTESDSVIDINSADGQEITAIIPFFGDAAFGAAQKSGILVVFKTNSIYLVDLAAKDAGQNAVQRLETRGKGCTAPYSVAVTKGGIMFANESGMYKLSRDLKVDYVGRKYMRKFDERVNKSRLDIATGHHDTQENSYKLSYATTGNSENSEVAVYNHVREYQGQGEGSWTTYTNHPATGWANLVNNRYFSSTSGRVFSVRNTGDVTDYRDDNVAIPMTVTTRAMDMLESGKRKIFQAVVTHYRAVATSVGTTLEAAVGLKRNFQSTDAFNINANTESSGIGDEGGQKVVSIVTSIRDNVGVYLQLKYSNSTIDEPLEIAGIDVKVAAKSIEGITQASQT